MQQKSSELTRLFNCLKQNHQLKDSVCFEDIETDPVEIYESKEDKKIAESIQEKLDLANEFHPSNR